MKRLAAVAVTFVLMFLAGIVQASAPAMNDPSGIKRTVTEYIRGYYGGKEVMVTLNNFPIDIGAGSRLQAISFSHMPDKDGKGVCAVSAVNQRGLERQFYVSFLALEKRTFFVTKRTIRRGDLIKEQDLDKRQAHSKEDSAQTPQMIEDILDKAAKRDIQPGTKISFQMIEDPIAIQRGDLVTIVAENERIAVQAHGKALDRGRIGDRIRVRNENSGKNITGRVASAGVVRVEW
jgi:flagella basal body P-ring formation protein FlgA